MYQKDFGKLGTTNAQKGAKRFCAVSPMTDECFKYSS